MPVLRRDVGGQHVRGDRLEGVRLDMLAQRGDVGRQHGVDGAVLAFRLHALEDAALDVLDVDLDAAVLGESIEQRADQELLAIGVEVHFAPVGQRRAGEGGDGGDRGDRQISGFLERRHRGSRYCVPVGIGRAVTDWLRRPGRVFSKTVARC